MKITGTINFELDDKDFKKGGVEVQGVVVSGVSDDVSRERIKRRHLTEIEQRIKKMEMSQGMITAGAQLLLQWAAESLRALHEHHREVSSVGEKPAEPLPFAPASPPDPMDSV